MRSCSCKSFLYRTLPVLKWLPEYQWKKNISGDIISGITVGIMHIPQGIAYSLLGNVPPAVGIYAAFFPVIIYVFFGTSKHVSMGIFAIVCLMTGKVVSEHSTEEGTDRNNMEHYSSVDVSITITLAVALWMIIMYILRLGFVANLLSDVLVNSFTCAAGWYVIVSQMKDLLGLPIGRRDGWFNLPLSIYDILTAIRSANLIATTISVISIAIMTINNEIFKSWLAKTTKIPFPIELIVIIIGTTTSYFGDFNAKYNVTIVGGIPSGVPIFSLLPEILWDTLVITVVSYAISISMILILANKLRYKVDANQELLAMGLGNLFGAFFSSMPMTASLSRSLVQEAVGGVSQIASLASCSVLLVVLLWISPAFEHLPRCILASIIVVALKGMLVQCVKLKQHWKLSKWDASVWIITFATTMIVTIDIGLIIGIMASLLSIFVQNHVPYSCLLGVLPNTNLYLDINRHKKVKEIEGIKIFHYGGPLNFVTEKVFTQNLKKRIGFNIVDLIAKDHIFLVKCVIIDCSAMTYVDPIGVNLLRELRDTYEEIGVVLYMTNCSSWIYETLRKCEKYDSTAQTVRVFPTTHDAVVYAKNHIVINNI